MKIELVKKLLEVLNEVESLIDENEGINFISNDFGNSFNTEKINLVSRVCDCLDIKLEDILSD